MHIEDGDNEATVATMFGRSMERMKVDENLKKGIKSTNLKLSIPLDTLREGYVFTMAKH